MGASLIGELIGFLSLFSEVHFSKLEFNPTASGPWKLQATTSKGIKSSISVPEHYWGFYETGLLLYPGTTL